VRKQTVLGIGLVVALVAAAVVGWRVLIDDAPPEATGRMTDACRAAGPVGLVGLDLDTGKEKWTNVVGDDVANVWTPGPDGDVSSGDSSHVWVISSTAKVRRLKASTGAVDQCPSIRSMAPNDIGRPARVDESGATARDRIMGVVEVREADETHRWEVEDSYLVGSSRGGVVVRSDMNQSCCANQGLDGTIRVLEPATGKVRWTRPITGSSATVTASHLVVVGDGQEPGTVEAPGKPAPTVPITAYDIADGSTVWSTEVSGSPWQAYADAGLVLVPGSNGGPILTVLDEATGTERWTATLPEPGRGGRYTAPGSVVGAAVAGDTVAVAVESEAPYRD
jgi:outer membrane protein assembly factor BamB